jgi:hypothetical protein
MGGIKQSRLFRQIYKNGFWDENMGLDQYAYIAARENQRHDYWAGVVPKKDTKLGELHYENLDVQEPIEIAYWRKHPNLQGWMEQLFAEKGGECDTFNGVEVELTWEDIDRLEQVILAGQLPPTQGFFFGNDSDEYYREQDLEFCRRAKAELFMGLKVFYNSSW